MSLTRETIDELEAKALEGLGAAEHRSESADAIKALAAEARINAGDGSRYRVTTPDGIQTVMTAREYLAMTATDLSGSVIEMVR